MKKTLVSVLMPNYNCEKYISEAIESILNQNFTDFEFIIIDDGSTDRSWEIIQQYVKKDERIQALKNEKNLGISGNRNKLLKLAKCKYIIWQDSDDISLSYRIEKQYNFMEKHPEVGICGGGLQFFNENGDSSKRLYRQNDSELRKTIFRYSPVALPASIMRRNVIIKIGGFLDGLDVAEDLHLSFRVGEKYNFANIEGIVLRYRENIESTTFKKLRKMELETLKIRWKNSKTEYYSMNKVDIIYNILQYISIYIIPIKFKIKLFNFIRNS